MAFDDEDLGYGKLIEIISGAAGVAFRGPASVWFRLNHPMVKGEAISLYQRVAVAADSGNGVSASLDFRKYAFVKSDLTINLLGRPVGEWICLDARSLFGGNGYGLSKSPIDDEAGLIGQATQSLAVRARQRKSPPLFRRKGFK